MYKVLYKYEASTDTDIHLNIGDKIIQVEDVGNGWSLGHNVTRGKTGTFPSSFITSASAFRKTIKSIKKIKFNLNSGVDDEKSQCVDNLIPKTKAIIPDNILQQVPGKEEVFGVKHRDSERKTNPLQSASIRKNKRSSLAQFKYEATSDTDIHLNIGDKITQVVDCGNGWSLGYNDTQETTGTFPSSFLSSTNTKKSLKKSSKSKKKFEFNLNSDIETIPEEQSQSLENLIPKTKAFIPDNILQRRLSRIPVSKQKPNPLQSATSNFLQSPVHEHRLLKGVLGIFGGFIACGILFLLLRYSYGYTFKISAFITAGTALPICGALAFSTHMRCIMLLMVPTLFTGKGRAVFMSIIFAALLAGPVVNIAYNAQQASQSMACTQELIYNQTLILKGQLEEPIRKLEKYIYDGLVRMKQIAQDIKDFIKPITDAVSAMINGLNQAKDALATAAQKCSSGIEKAQTSCENGINGAKDKCERVLRDVDPTGKIIKFGKDVGRETKNVVDHIDRGTRKVVRDIDRGARKVVRDISRGFRDIWGKKRKRRAMTEDEKNAIELAKQLIGTPTLLKKNAINLRPKNPKKITDQSTPREQLNVSTALHRYRRFSILDKVCVVLKISAVCKVVQVGQAVCIPMKYISKVIGMASDGIKSGLDAVVSFFYFDFDGYIDAGASVNSSKTAAQIIAEVKADILSKSSEILTVAGIVSNILVLTLIILFIQSIFYVRKFLTNDRFDNFYITNAFKEYDAQLKASGKPNVLPLKRKETRKYIDTRSLLLSRKEFEQSKSGFGKVGTHLLIATAIIFFDYILYFVLTLIDRYGNLNINIGGSSTLEVSVEGEGLFTKFLSAFVDELDLDSNFEVVFNMTTCIPNPSQPDNTNIYKFTFFYFFAFIFIIMQAYGFRIRRKIAAFFYPDRDAERIQYLHEKIRHKRKSFFNWIKHQLVSRNKQQHMENRITLRGLIEYKHPYIAKYLCCCLPKKTTCIGCLNEDDGRIPFHKCPKCESNYCEDCFSDMENECLICQSRVQASEMKLNSY